MNTVVRSTITATILGLFAAGLAGAVTVTIDDGVRYQTIEGFGGFAPTHQWWLDGPFYNDAHLARIVDTLGVTLVREQLYFDFEPTNDNADPGVANLAGFNLNGFLGKQLPFWRALKAKADASDEVLRLIFTIWSPPAWMKTNNSVIDGGELREDMYEEFAEYCLEYVKMVERETGIVPYALSLANEPAWPQNYESCVYTPQQLIAVVKTVGARFEAEGITTRFFYAEDMLSNFMKTPYIGLANNDPVARGYLHSWAFHGYADGVMPTPVSQAASLWRTVATRARTANIPVWMTETEGHDNTWDGGMLLANWISAALKYGNVSAFCYFYLSGSVGATHGFIAGGVPNRRFDAARHFYRFIRPGAVMLDCISADTAVMTLAFAHPEKRTLTVIAVNFSSDSRTVDLAGNRLPSAFTMYRSSSVERCARTNAVGATNIALPAQSIVTLVADNYDMLSAGVRPTAAGAAPAVAQTHATARVYTLTGRQLDQRSLSAVSHTGAGIIVTTDKRGAAVVSTRQIK